MDKVEPQGTMKALIIGISDYNSEDLKPLPFCKKDGEEIYENLKSIGYEIFGKNALTGEVKSENMRESIYDFFTSESIKPEDTLLFYYSGHGIPDSDGDVYILHHLK